MLASPYQGDIDKLIDDDRVVFEQKLDGERVIVHIKDGEVTCWSRTGFQIELDPEVHKELERFDNEEWIFDGEYVNDAYNVFDAPMLASKSTVDLPYSSRKKALQRLFSSMQEEEFFEHIGAVNTAISDEEKQMLWLRTLNGKMEGVMVKYLDSKYEAGKRSKKWLKVKHTETADVVVIETGRGNTGRAVTIGMYKNGELQEVAGCKIPRDDLLDDINPGTVLEVKYLYATQDDRLYQPVFVRIRTDKQPEDCVLEGLKLPDKHTIIDIEQEQ